MLMVAYLFIVIDDLDDPSANRLENVCGLRRRNSSSGLVLLLQSWIPTARPLRFLKHYLNLIFWHKNYSLGIMSAATLVAYSQGCLKRLAGRWYGNPYSVTLQGAFQRIKDPARLHQISYSDTKTAHWVLCVLPHWSLIERLGRVVWLGDGTETRIKSRSKAR